VAPTNDSVALDDRIPNGRPANDDTGRERLQRGRVLIVGVGALGCPAALALAGAGVGHLGLIDGDAVEISNLHRQIVYRSADLGQPKVQAAAARIAQSHPRQSLSTYEEPLSATNLPALFAQHDFVIDATDGVGAKYLINDGAVLHRTAFSHAGIIGFQGQTLTVLPGRSACLRCLFPSPPPAEDMPTCRAAGVVGALAGVLGSVQATQAVSYLTGTGSLLTNRMLMYDALNARWRRVELSRARSCPLCSPRPTITSLAAVSSDYEPDN